MRLGRKPRQGDRRVVLRFALLPMVMTDGTRVWLEHYTARQVYTSWGFTEPPMVGWGSDSRSALAPFVKEENDDRA